MGSQHLGDEVSGLNVVILPSRPINKEAINLSNEIFNSGLSSFALEDGKLYPHITLYQAYFPTRNIPIVKAELSAISKSLENFRIDLNSFSVEFDNWLFWNCAKTKYLENLQATIIERLNPLREGNLPPTINVNNLTNDYKEDLEKFGTLLVGSRYMPHITIAHIKEAKDAQVALEKAGNSLERVFICSGISLTMLGSLGTVTEII
jgi:2'-5' RNA ligase